MKQSVWGPVANFASDDLEAGYWYIVADLEAGYWCIVADLEAGYWYIVADLDTIFVLPKTEKELRLAFKPASR